MNILTYRAPLDAHAARTSRTQVALSLALPATPVRRQTDDGWTFGGQIPVLPWAV